MIDTPTIDYAFALHQVKPFNSLTENELLLVAQHSRSKTFDTGVSIIAAGAVSEILFTQIDGYVLAGGRRAPHIFDAPSVLFGAPARKDYSAGPDGARLLCLSKPHLFTIARECPDFIVGLKDVLEQS